MNATDPDQRCAIMINHIANGTYHFSTVEDAAIAPETFDPVRVVDRVMAIVIIAPFLRAMLDHAVLVTIAG